MREKDYFGAVPAQPAPRFLAEELERLRAQHRLRTPPQLAGLKSFATNDFLGLARHPIPLPALPSTAGARGSRLITGNDAETLALEAALADWLQTPSALTFTSGYAANVGSLSALLGADDVAFSDSLNHASLIDGLRLSRASIKVFAHNDLAALERLLRETPATRRRWVVTESYFSMDADSPDLRALRALCDRHDALLYLDEAHALGVLGPKGRGLAAESSVRADVLVGTLGKAVGCQGAFVAGAATLYEYLWNRARSFVFSTGLSPLIAAQSLANLGAVIAADPQRAALAARARRFRSHLEDDGHACMGFGCIVPLIVGSEQRALQLAAALAASGFHVQPIRPPTVAPGASRLRVTLSAADSDEDCDTLATRLLELLR